MPTFHVMVDITRHRALRHTGAALLLLAAAVVVTGMPDRADADAAPARDHQPVPGPPRPTGGFSNGQAAIDRLGVRFPDVALLHDLDAATLEEMLLTDPTLAVDRFGSLAYFEYLPPDEPAPAPVAAAGDGLVEAPPTTGPEFQLESLPGAAFTIHLDFDGHVTRSTTWNAQFGIAEIVSPPFDRDGDPGSWSTEELAIIRYAWAVVAEDYAPWQVNVTTIDPGPEALSYSGWGDPGWGVRAVVTADTFASCRCGGHAYIGSFTDSVDEPVFVYNTSAVGVSEAISHEVGHTLALSHDGSTTHGAYYYGHDGVGPGWAPIMGASYYEEVTQWSRQEYVHADNHDAAANYGQGPDDLAVISATGHGRLPLRVDDHGVGALATPLTGDPLTGAGIIETPTDVDGFSFTTDGGTVTVAARPAPVAPNLDVALSLRDAVGALVASSDPVDLLDAALSVIVPAGTYTVEIDGAGAGNPFIDPPSGYTDYGSLGRYTVSVTVEAPPPPDTTPPAAPTGLVARLVDDAVSLGWDANVDEDLSGYVVEHDDGNGFVELVTTATNAITHDDVAAGTHTYRVTATDLVGNRSAASDPVAIVVPTRTTATVDVAVVGVVEGDLSGTWAADGIVQSVTEVPSDGKPASRHDLLEHRWELPALTGGHQLTIHASTVDGGDADDGVWFEVSDDGERWEPVVHVPADSSVAASFDIGQRGGTVHVRVVDSDRSIGQQGDDRVEIDVLHLTADGVALRIAGPSSVSVAITASTQGGELGRQFGVATAVVLDDRGGAVAGALVRIRLGGSFDEEVEGTTVEHGSVTVISTASERKPTVAACVLSVDTELTYLPGDEAC